MTRVLHISSAKVWRGAEQQVHFLLNADNPDFDNYLFCPENAALLEKNGSLKHKTGTYKKIFGWDIAGGLRLNNFIKEKKIELAHIHDSHALNLYWTAYLLGAKIPAVYHKHHDHPIKNSRKYKHAAIKKVICVSKAVFATAAKKINAEKLALIHPAIQNEPAQNNTSSLRNEYNLPRESLIAGMVSALEKEKNIAEFIEIAKKYTAEQKTPFYFIIVGRGSYEKDIREQILKSGLENKILLTGFREDMSSILQQLDIFLFTSLSEGFPLAVLEAMQAGVPVITRDSGGIKEIISNEKNGLIFHSPKEACEKIHFLLHHPQEKKEMALLAKNFASQFSAEQMIQKTYTLYKEILS